MMTALFFLSSQMIFKAISQYSKKCENMVNFLLLLFQKSLIFPLMKKSVRLLKNRWIFFFSFFFFDFWSSLFVSHRLRAGNNNEH